MTSDQIESISYKDATDKLKKKDQRKIDKKLEHYYNTASGKLIQEILTEINDGKREYAENKLVVAVAVSLQELLIYQYQKKQSDNSYKAFIPMSLRCSKLTNASCEEYHAQSTLKTWMGAVNREATSLLIELKLIERENPIWPDEENYYGKAMFYDAYKLINLYVKKLKEKVSQQKKNYHSWNFSNLSYSTQKTVGKSAAKGEWGKHEKQLPKVTQITLQKLRESTFRFNRDYYQKCGISAIHSYCTFCQSGGADSYMSRMSSILYSLNQINTKTSALQYHGTWEIQGPGRLHTIGGVLNLPKVLRWLLILPSEPKDKVLLELDLKSAQLIVLCKELQCYDLLSKIKEIMEKKESVWDYIVPDNDQVPKRALKVLVYGLCFGAPLDQLLSLCNRELYNEGSDFRFSQEQIDQILDGFLKPLVSARKTFLKKYTIEKIKKLVKQKKRVIISNRLGRKLHLGEERSSYLKENKKHYEQSNKGINPYQISKKALAHIAQGNEQYIMQSLIASDVIRENINAFQFDGLTLEVARNEVTNKKRELDEWLSKFDPDMKFSYEVIDLQNDPKFDHYQHSVDGTDIIQELCKL